MVRKIEKDGKTFYACEVCGLMHKEKLWADKCQDYYTHFRACSLNIISCAVGATE